MSTTEVLHGHLQPDGTLELDSRPTLAAGPVIVTLESESPRQQRDPWLVLERIWEERKALGLSPRSAREIDADVRRQREEWEERQVELERLQQEARRREP